jgi:hypothetical protein
VELKCSGGTTAPVRGSKAWPAWTARVLNPWFSSDMVLLFSGEAVVDATQWKFSC